MMATHGALRLARALCTSFPTPRLFRGPPPTQSQRRVASKVHQVLVQTLARGLVRDRWLQDGAAIHILNWVSGSGGVKDALVPGQTWGM